MPLPSAVRLSSGCTLLLVPIPEPPTDTVSPEAKPEPVTVKLDPAAGLETLALIVGAEPVIVTAAHAF